MPEGDTIHRTANTLERALAEKQIIRFESRVAAISTAAEAAFKGQTIARVEARGKNLLIQFSNGLVLHTHMRMKGSWHIYKTGEKWRMPGWQARVIIGTSDYVAVCFNAPVVRLLKAADVDEEFSRLGTDVANEVHPAKDLEMFRKHPDLEIGEALLKQSILSGIGNVFKNEILFAQRINPFVRVKDLDDATLQSLILTGSRMLQRNLSGEVRRTRFTMDPRGNYFVYKRNGFRCRLCGTRIEMKRQGEAFRSTYYCPTCQNVR